MIEMNAARFVASLLIVSALGAIAIYSYRPVRWHPNYATGAGMPTFGCSCQAGYTMMGGPPAAGEGYAQTSGLITLEDAIEAFQNYISGLGGGFELREVMEFQNNFYAVIVESDTGIGAFELLLWKSKGRITPEPGPNMMWNLKYGMHRIGPQGDDSADLTPDQAVELALRSLRSTFPGAEVEVEESVEFYGYYTMDYVVNGRVIGMLSVNSLTGEIWYHTWHGYFVQEAEFEGGGS